VGEGRRYRERQTTKGGERRDKVVREGTQTQDTGRDKQKDERRKEVVVEHIFIYFEKGKRKSCEGGFIFNDFDKVSMNNVG
jgi:hypothetical protein